MHSQRIAMYNRKSFGEGSQHFCHKGTCRFLQGPTSFDRMRSVLAWSESNSVVPSSV